MRAAIGYFASQKSVKPDGHYLVFDFGGGTHDVALIHIVGGLHCRGCLVGLFPLACGLLGVPS